MNNSKIDNFNEINFSKLTASIEDTVKVAMENYWELDNIRVKTNAINNFRDFRQEAVISKINFFSSQIKVQNHRPVIFRLCEEFVDGILTKVLKNSPIPFSLQRLTELEVRILNSFCEFLYKKIDAILIPTTEVKITEQSDKNINIVLFVSLGKDECSKIMLSIPQDRFKFEQLKKVVSFRDENFLTSSSIVKIKAGSSKITLDELKNLSSEDIVLLENSNSTKLTLVSGALTKVFSTKADPSLILNIETDETEDESDINRVLSDDEVSMEKNLWDDIQIEINAEFEKVKMTIGELKQITQGQIVDLGSVFDNEISLFVENKIVAKGQLVIINDKYAVKLDKVFSPQQPVKPPIQSAKPQTAAPAKPQAAPPRPQTAAKPLPKGVPPKPQAAAAKQIPHPAPRPVSPKPQPQPAQKEDFDYSDFEK